MMTVRCYSLHGRQIRQLYQSVRCMIHRVSGLIAVIAFLNKAVQFVDVTCGAEARPSWTSLHTPAWPG